MKYLLQTTFASQDNDFTKKRQQNIINNLNKQ